jgi:hypothetical protein
MNYFKIGRDSIHSKMSGPYSEQAAMACPFQSEPEVFMGMGETKDHTLLGAR